MKINFINSLFFGITSLLYCSAIAAKHDKFTQQENRFIYSMVHKYHCKASTVRLILKKAQFRADVLRHIRKPYEEKPWYQYKKLFITESRINKGVKFWQHYNDTLQFMNHQFNVPSKIIVAILGVETSYGEQMGKFRVLNSLTTLSFYYPERTKFFRAQLAEFIMYCVRNHINPTSVFGSYAGAIGQPQFMPSNIKIYAVNSDKKSVLDLQHNEGDVIASISNFLAKNGWHANQAIIIRAKFLAHVDIKKIYKKYAGRHLALKTWRRLGVEPMLAPTKNKDYPLRPTLLAMPLKHGNEYWLAFHNFKVIKSYNNSDNYALAVTTLGSLVRARYIKLKEHK